MKAKTKIKLPTKNTACKFTQRNTIATTLNNTVVKCNSEVNWQIM